MKKKAFTLIELLVVISIIALLLSILLPSLQKARGQAKTVLCVSQKKQWGLVMVAFTMDNKGYFDEGHKTGWWEELYPYYKSMPEIIFCTETKQDAAQNNNNDITYNVWARNIVAGANKTFYGSIGKNTRLIQTVRNASTGYPSYNDNPAEFCKKMADVPQASRVPLFFDAAWIDCSFSSKNGICQNYPPPKQGAFLNSLEVTPVTSGAPYGGCRPTLNRHGSKREGLTTAVFVDGSARKVYLKELWVLKWNKIYETNAKLRLGRWPDWMSTFKDFGTQLNTAEY